MAEKEEREIPVFTVIKNGAILKNIFLINNPPSPPSISIKSVENEETPDQEDQEILIVGRHPDCHIMLTHPSISRFHLQIQSNPSSQKLSVIDLSSIHGTWVSEEKIEPGIPVEMNEGDTLKIGVSTRVYRLHWVPLSQAYDISNPFVSPIDLKELKNQGLEERNEVDSQQDEESLLADIEKIEGQDSLAVERKEEGKCEDAISALIQDKSTPSLDLSLEGIVSLFSDENSESNPENEITSCGIESVDLSSLVGDKTSVSELGKENQIPRHDSKTNVIPGTVNPDCFLGRSEEKSEALVNLFASPSDEEKRKILGESKNQSSLQKDSKLKDDSEVWSKSLVKVLGVLSEVKLEQHNKLPSLAVIQTLSDNSSVDPYLNSLVNQNSTCFDEGSCCPPAGVYEEAENPSSSSKCPGLKGIPSSDFGLLEAESVNSSLPSVEVITEVTDNKKCQNRQSLFSPERVSSLENSECSTVRSDKRATLSSIWSRRGKPTSILQIQTRRCRGKTIRDCNNADIESPKQDDMENRSISNILFSGSEDMEEDFTPEKENLTPNTVVLKSLKRKGKLEEIKQSRSCRKSSSKVIFGPSIQPEDDPTLTSGKENQTPKVLQEQKLMRGTDRKVKLEREGVQMKGRAAERVPFQPLSVNSPCARGNKRSEASFSNATTRSSNSVKFTRTTEVADSSAVGEGRRSWTMVVDTNTLLDNESRKSLQLLQGLKGTQLIIPGMVIRELDCLKRRGSLFRRKSEVSSLLEWIEECMVKTNWWIHIQNSVEGRPVAPTPPASPQSQFSEGSGVFPCGTTCWGPFSSRTSLTEIVSPTSEDHILDYTLLFKNMKNDRHLVLLSNDVTMKIKAMSEGLICETAPEFRESLVNPFSERFLWADSSPRGRTWSVLDDVVLREKYSHGPSKKKPSKGGDGAKGLKLILLHNSHYAQISSVR